MVSLLQYVGKGLKIIIPAIKNGGVEMHKVGLQTLLPLLPGPSGAVSPRAVGNGWAGVSFLLYFIFSFAPFISSGALTLLSESTK